MSDPANAPESPASNPYKAPPYWHEDGDIILRVKEDNGEDHQFRIHKFVLTVHSQAFKDMVALGTQVHREYSEVPVVELKDDAVADVRALLMVLYEGFALQEAHDEMTFGEALGVLRLSHKYQFDTFYKAIIRSLKGSWPLNRAEYRALRTKFLTSRINIMAYGSARSAAYCGN
ncbi:hypothetical protein M422DRAFT_49199 [Sphaerobolus stellatus SS14]|uniref:BTB domain-containing protein n=1 Tax=Sphaerobolus stellatus (strain SS14) TaxID=990650 RepID=A0A0C9VPX4_SPHS4|nr:hypothetical protein M422DRAFT_49199 [Sphaerobolus stellatus SS14]